MSNAPRPGSVAERSILQLTLHGRMSSQDLADKIDADSGSMHASLSLAVQGGLIVRELGDAHGGPYYSLPFPPMPEPDPFAMGMNIPKFVEVLEKMSGSMKKPCSTEGSGERVYATRKTAPAEPVHFEIGLFSDGRLVLEYGKEQLSLTPAERDKLHAFLVSHQGAA